VAFIVPEVAAGASVVAGSAAAAEGAAVATEGAAVATEGSGAANVLEAGIPNNLSFGQFSKVFKGSQLDLHGPADNSDPGYVQ
jgi:hypothetical protein